MKGHYKDTPDPKKCNMKRHFHLGRVCACVREETDCGDRELGKQRTLPNLQNEQNQQSE